jgi:hypothetical protein
LVLLSLLWAVEASAGSRVSLLSFEGDRARPIRWRVAQVLRRAGHTVLGFAPASARSSAGALRDYADDRNVDLFVSGATVEGPEGWQLELRFRGPDGKAVAQPLRFEADDLRRLVQELKGDGQAKLDRLVRGNSTGSSAELPSGRALPLPKRRARPVRKVDDRPVLPGEAPAEEEPKAVAKRAPREVDLDAASAERSGEQTWDADGDESSEPKRGRPAKAQSRNSFLAAASAATRAPAQSRAAKKRSAQRLAGAGAAADDPGSIDLDADTRGALDERPSSKAAAGDPLAGPEPLAADDGSGSASSAEDPEPISMDDEPAAEESEAKPKRKKRGLFAGKLSRKKQSGDENAERAELEPGGETTIEDRDPYGEGSASSRDLPNARISARAGFMRRALTYTDDRYNRLRTPTTNGWVYRLDGALFPFARPLKDRLALIGSYEGALAGTVRDERAGREFGVTFSQLEGGLRYRQPLGQHELGAQLTVGAMNAGLDGSAVVSGVPEISYTLLSPAVSAALHFGPVALQASVAYQYTLGGLGEFASAEWFPRVEGSGVQGQVGLEYRISRNLSLQASGALRRFVLDMNSRPDDARRGEAEVAGGAVDLYTTGYFGLAFTL